MDTVQTIQKSLRIPREIVEQIEQIADNSGRDFSSIVKDLLSEAVKMRRCPGVMFSNGVSGRRARIAGTGIEIWEVIATYKSVGKDFTRLKNAYHWLSDQQLKAAIGYYTIYNSEIDALIEKNNAWTPDTVEQHYPFLTRGDM